MIRANAEGLRRAAILAAAFLILAAAGCGGGSSKDSRSRAAEITNAFESITGDRLLYSALDLTPSPVHRLSFDLLESKNGETKFTPVSRQLQEKYGQSILIYVNPRVLKEELGDEPPDPEGIHWEQATHEAGEKAGERYRVAKKKYSFDVLLVWFPPGDEKEIVEQWRRLDRALSAAT